jgi:hypothetical protein
MSGIQTLLEALAGSKHGITDPRLNLLQAAPGAVHGSTDARVAPPPSNPSQPTGAAGTTNPGIALINAYQEWLRRSGRSQDPLAARIGQKAQPGIGGAMASDPIKLLTQGGQPFHEVSHGENAGQFAQTYDLGNGQKANVYYDRGGRRRVNVY